MQSQIKPLRTILTKTLNSLALECQNIPLDERKINVLVDTVKEKSTRLEVLNSAFIEEISDQDDRVIEKEFEKIEEYRDKVTSCLADAKFLLNSSVNTTSVSSNSNSSSLKLPKLQLPVFSGDVLLWQEFHESFSAAVDNSSISDVEKFQYLKGQLKGEAAALLSGLPLISSNYKVACDLLTQRYGSKRRRLRAHVRSLLSLNSPDMRDLYSLRNFVDNVNKNMRGLESLNVVSGDYEIFLCEILITKVPHQIKHEWAKLDDDDMNTEELLKIIENEAKLLEIMKSTSSQGNNSSSSKFSSVNQSRQKFSSCNVTQATIKCPFCHSTEHKSFYCKLLIEATIPKRIQMVKDAKVCFNCFESHSVKDCRRTSRCRVCNQKHNTLIHNHSSEVIEEVSSNFTEVHSLNTRASYSTSFVLPVITIPFTSSNGTCNLGALLDTGSQRTFIRRSALKSISYKILKSEVFNIQGFGQKQISENCQVVSASASSEVGDIAFNLIATDNMNSLSNVLNVDSTKFQFNEAINLCPPPSTIDVIVGADTYYQFVTGNTRKLSRNIFAIETIFGYAIHGTAEISHKDPTYNLVTLLSDNSLEELNVKKFWNTELSGILPASEEIVNDDKKVATDFEANIHMSNDRYVVKFPWLQGSCLFSSYASEAKIRLFQTVRKLVRSNLLHQYDSIIKEYLSLEIVEKVDESDTTVCRYLPHHGVVRQDKSTTKLRIVFDASAKSNNENSLNDCLLEGPSLYPDIIGIILRFRLHPFALIGDVEKAFLQISLDERDRDFTRFYWFDEQLSSNSWPTVRESTYRFTRVPFGIKSSPFLLNATINHHINKYSEVYPTTTKYLRTSIYVDDFITSVPTNEDLGTTINETKLIFQEMKMKMHKWNSNAKINDASDISTVKVLGIHWNTKTDSLGVKFEVTTNIRTKRHLASVVCGFYDPVGLFSPFTLKFKLLLQKCWQLKCDWDDPLPVDYINEASKLASECSEVNEMSIQRYLQFSLEDQCIVQLHGFGDASPNAYGSAVYLFCRTSTSTAVNLVASKSRLASPKSMSLPRLELMAAVINARLLKKICDEMPFIKNLEVYAWSDSKVALCWIQGTGRDYKQFVHNRTSEIRRLVKVENWRYINSKDNPADFLTKSFKAKAWLHSDLWWHGPQALHDNNKVHDVPKEETVILQADKELKSSFKQLTISISKPIIDITRFSQFNRLLHTMCYVFKVFHRLKTPDFSAHDLQQAKVYLIKLCQQQQFPEEYSTLMASKVVSNSSRLFLLQPFLDDKFLIRVRGRIGESELPYDTRHPIILSNKCHFTHLIIRHFHLDSFHSGVSHLTNQLRQTYWILKCRQTVKSVIHQCIKCRGFKAKQCCERFAPLPPDRVTASQFRAFECTGVDYFGPIIMTKDNTKLYVLLLTCLKVRAVHLELTTSLDTSNFIKAFKRFVSRRGVPTVIRSDNAKTFKCASSILCGKYNIQWLFNVERAPWTGGVWERLVRSVKTSLRVVLKQCSASYTDLETTLCQIESIINSRPITYSTGNEEEILPLCPINFLLMPNSNRPDVMNVEATRDMILTCIADNSKIMKLFWKRWKEQYLIMLNENRSRSSGNELKEGSIAILNEGTKREYWPLVKVVEVRKGRDGIVRSVKILCRNKLLCRPIKLLYDLEINK